MKLTRTLTFLLYKELSQAGLWPHLFEPHSILQPIKQFFVAKLTHLLNTLTLTQWYSLCLDENPLALLKWVELLISVLPSEMFKGSQMRSYICKYKIG